MFLLVDSSILRRSLAESLCLVICLLLALLLSFRRYVNTTLAIPLPSMHQIRRTIYNEALLT